MASAVERVSINVDRGLLVRAERLRLATGESRSALVSRALRRLLAAEEHARKVEEYVEAYQRHPEGDARQVQASRALARRSLSGVDWEDG